MKRILLTAFTLMALSSVTVYANKSKKPVKKHDTECCSKKQITSASSCHKTCASMPESVK